MFGQKAPIRNDHITPNLHGLQRLKTITLALLKKPQEAEGDE